MVYCLINQAQASYWKTIGPSSWEYGPRCTHRVRSRASLVDKRFITWLKLPENVAWQCPILRWYWTDSGAIWLIDFKALANEDTLLRTHFCGHKCFPVCPRAQHLLRTQILCPGHKKCFWFCSEKFCVRSNVSQFAQPKKHHGQQCVRNYLSSFNRAFSYWPFELT